MCLNCERHVYMYTYTCRRATSLPVLVRVVQFSDHRQYGAALKGGKQQTHTYQQRGKLVEEEHGVNRWVELAT